MQTITHKHEKLGCSRYDDAGRDYGRCKSNVAVLSNAGVNWQMADNHFLGANEKARM